ncbi:MAG: DUF1731 domain-containing protein, partial [Dysgonamonadaceae bacterium]|nr:DUF1731 domain-containing protein [Dysgonamonadaceae bacterium]
AEFMKTMAKLLRKPMFLPRVPEFVFRLFFGEAAQIILEGSRISSQKIRNTGFEFKYKTIHDALKAILLKRKEKKSQR